LPEEGAARSTTLKALCKRLIVKVSIFFHCAYDGAFGNLQLRIQRVKTASSLCVSA
jgi:hypothetical protein